MPKIHDNSTVAFTKVNGCGNDFILFNNMNNNLPQIVYQPSFVRKICTRRFSIGADGVIILEPHAHEHFQWQFFNQDGSTSEMCGNGARCAAYYAFMEGIAPAELSFVTKAGIIYAQVENDEVKIKMPPPTRIELSRQVILGATPIAFASISTGIPHVVIERENIYTDEIVHIGDALRTHELFGKEGTNVNFTQRERDIISIRTFERGVQEETWACGTGAMATALIYASKYHMPSPVKIKVKSNEILSIYFEQDEHNFRNVYLQGKATITYCGNVSVENCFGDDKKINDVAEK